MARKRLSGPQPDYLAGPEVAPATLLRGPLPPTRAPIAQVAAETAALAAFEEVSAELQVARDEGRMVLSLPLSGIAMDYLIRDRIDPDAAAMTALIDSLRARGQQSPIEVVDRGADFGPGRYGLISGWRRCLALAALAEETGDDRFTHVLALIRRPETGSAAYVAMVEENEVRAGLSFYERARIVMRAVEAGIFPTEKKALQGLFATASHAKRSKVKSFIPVVTALDGALRFPARIPERTGLALSKVLEADATFGPHAQTMLNALVAQTPEDEAKLLAHLLRKKTKLESNSEVDPVPSGIALSGGPGRITLQGEGVDAAFLGHLRLWLTSRS